MQRSYVQHLAGSCALNGRLLDAQRTLLEEALAAQQPACSSCGGLEMEAAEPATVLYLGTQRCFKLSVPMFGCLSPACSGRFAPSPFAVGCFPATPKASLNVTLAGPQYPARWFDLQLLQLTDSIIFGGGRSPAVYTVAGAIHRQYTLNRCSDVPGWEHFKRQMGEALQVRGQERAGRAH